MFYYLFLFQDDSEIWGFFCGTLMPMYALTLLFQKYKSSIIVTLLHDFLILKVNTNVH